MKNVILKRQCTLILGIESKPLKCGDYAVISNENYAKFKDWFQLIEDVPDTGSIEPLEEGS